MPARLLKFCIAVPLLGLGLTGCLEPPPEEPEPVAQAPVAAPPAPRRVVATAPAPAPAAAPAAPAEPAVIHPLLLPETGGDGGGGGW